MYGCTGVRHEGGVSVIQAWVRNGGTCRSDGKGDAQAGSPPSARVSRWGTGTESLVGGKNVLSWDRTEGASSSGVIGRATRKRRTRRGHAKPLCIAIGDVEDAYKRVKANHGAAGVDGQTIEQFEEEWEHNLYRLWNRLCSGSYFPPPVRRVAIPKDEKSPRPLGIPTVCDRIAQTVAH